MPSSKSYDYDYDEISRLVEGIGSRGSGWGYRGWDYDGAGNVTYKYHDESHTTGNCTTYSYTSGTNKLVDLDGYEDNEFAYAAAGSMSTQGPSGSDYEYVYDADERLVRVKDVSNATVVNYVYDGFNRRRTKLFANGDFVVFFYDQDGRLIEEIHYDDSEETFDIIDHLWMAGRLLARVDSGAASLGGSVNDAAVYWYHLDRLGTPLKMTDDSGTPATVWDADYTPYGETTINTETITNNVRMQGLYRDDESHSSDARKLMGTGDFYYSGNTGRGISAYHPNNSTLGGVLDEHGYEGIDTGPEIDLGGIYIDPGQAGIYIDPSAMVDGILADMGQILLENALWVRTTHYDANGQCIDSLTGNTTSNANCLYDDISEPTQDGAWMNFLYSTGWLSPEGDADGDGVKNKDDDHPFNKNKNICENPGNGKGRTSIAVSTSYNIQGQLIVSGGITVSDIVILRSMLIY